MFVWLAWVSPPLPPLFGALSEFWCPWIFTWIYNFVSWGDLRPEMFLLILLVLGVNLVIMCALVFSPLPPLMRVYPPGLLRFARGGAAPVAFAGVGGPGLTL